MPKIVTFAALKGGVGKSNFCWELGAWLSLPPNNKKVLLIDWDLQHTLTDHAGINNAKNAANNILLGKKVDIQNVSGYENMDIVPGSPLMDEAEDAIINDNDSYLKLIEWAGKNQKQLADYDYILQDTHPGMMRSTRNAVLFSDLCICPLTPGIESFNSHYDLVARVQGLSQTAAKQLGQQLATVKIAYVLNMIKPNTKLSQALVDNMGKSKDVIAEIPDRELFRQTAAEGKSLALLAQNTKGLSESSKTLLRQTNRQFKKIKAAIDRS